MISHNNMGHPTIYKPNYNNYTLGFANSKDEAMMAQINKGVVAYIFNNFKNEFYIKSVDAVTGQVKFEEFSYEQIVQQEPEPAVTMADLNNMEQRILSQITQLLQKPKEEDVCG